MGVEHGSWCYGKTGAACSVNMDNPFDTHPEKPYELRQGESVEVARFNRISAINRINFLVRQKVPSFDIHAKTSTYTQALDLEMWKRFYKDKPAEKISEEFCQKMAQVCIEMEGIEPILEADEFETALKASVSPTPPVKVRLPWWTTLTNKLIKFLDKCQI